MVSYGAICQRGDNILRAPLERDQRLFISGFIEARLFQGLTYHQQPVATGNHIATIL